MADNIYCKDCKSHKILVDTKDHCTSKQEYVHDPVYGKEPVFQDCRQKNKDLNCKEYEALERTVEIKSIR